MVLDPGLEGGRGGRVMPVNNGGLSMDRVALFVFCIWEQRQEWMDK